MADPGFPRRGGANFQGGGKNLLFGQIFPKNCMKMKEFGPRRGGHASLVPPLRSANGHMKNRQCFLTNSNDCLCFARCERRVYHSRTLYWVSVLVCTVLFLTENALIWCISAFRIHISKQTYIALKEHDVGFQMTMRGEMNVKVTSWDRSLFT